MFCLPENVIHVPADVGYMLHCHVAGEIMAGEYLSEEFISLLIIKNGLLLRNKVLFSVLCSTFIESRCILMIHPEKFIPSEFLLEGCHSPVLSISETAF